MAVSSSGSLATLRPDLAQTFEGYDFEEAQKGFVAMELFPLTPVASPAGNFGLLLSAQILIQQTDTRAPGAGYNRLQSQFTAKTYSCKEHGVEEPVDDRESKMYANYFDQEAFAARRARDTVLRNFEGRVLAYLNDYSNTSGGGANALHFFLGTTAAGNYVNAAACLGSWKTATTGATTGVNADIVTDIANASNAMYVNSGMQPNTVVMSYKKYWDVRRNATIQSQIKFSGLDDPKMSFQASRQILAELFGVSKVVVAGAQYATNNQAAASLTLNPFWSDDYVVLAKVATTGDFKEACVGRTFHWEADGSSANGTVETYRDERVRGNIVRVRMDTDEVPLLPQAAYLITGTNA